MVNCGRNHIKVVKKDGRSGGRRRVSSATELHRLTNPVLRCRELCIIIIDLFITVMNCLPRNASLPVYWFSVVCEDSHPDVGRGGERLAYSEVFRGSNHTSSQRTGGEVCQHQDCVELNPGKLL